MRQITAEELVALQQQHQSLIHWQQAKTFAEAWYGPKAAQVEVEFDNHYNDEYYEWRAESITVSDAEGNDLAPDLTLPAWQARMQEKKWEHYFEVDQETGAKTFDSDYGSRSFFQDAYDAFGKMSDEGDSLTFDLTTPPAELPRLFVEESVAV